jgi:hypothetical protein
LVAVGEAAGDGHTGQSSAPPDRHCSLSGVLPRHLIVRVRSWSTVGGFVLLWHRTVRCHTGQSGAPLTSCSDFCRDTVHLSESTIGPSEPLLRLLNGQSGGTPDSPVNYSGGRPVIPESGWFRVYDPGAPDTVRWHTGQSGAPL